MLEFGPASNQLAALVAGVRDNQLSSPTPCADTNLEALLGHIDEVSVSMTNAATKTVPGDSSQPSSANGSHLAPEWRTRIPKQLAALAEAWRDEAAWTGMTRAGAFEFPGEIAGVVTLNELVVHGWDVATASGQPFECEPQLVEAAYRAQQASVARNPNGLPGVFAKPVPVAEDAPLLDRLIGLSGRDPAWSPDGALV
jgi:uncharacterized protein (TIGR03086 family)